MAMAWANEGGGVLRRWLEAAAALGRAGSEIPHLATGASLGEEPQNPPLPGFQTTANPLQIILWFIVA